MSKPYRCLVLSCLLLGGGAVAAVEEPVDRALAEKFAALALDCVQREYPNKIAHVLNTAEDARTPSELHPAFYGCFDWHSSVHGHWLLVRLLRLVPDGDFVPAARAALAQSFTVTNIAAEAAYFQADNRKSYERPYGAAWLLQLMAELREWDDPQARQWRRTLAPLEQVIVGKLKTWLPKLAYPIRLGTHNQSAFAFGLMLDWAETAHDTEFAAMLRERSLAFHLDDVKCPLEYEPSGEDFLSPCLMEADLMRRLLPVPDFSRWLRRFLPQIPRNGAQNWLAVGIVNDPSDGKLVHLDGVNLSRAWNLENLADALPGDDLRVPALRAAALLHSEAGLANVSAEHYSGSHWLASFATYLITRRGR